MDDDCKGCVGDGDLEKSMAYWFGRVLGRLESMVRDHERGQLADWQWELAKKMLGEMPERWRSR